MTQLLKWDGSLLFSSEDSTVKVTLENAVKGGAYLDGAYLDGANLDGANLHGAYLHGAYLRGAYLDGANLDGANLDGANLDGANLRGAYLDGANLRGANLDGANLRGAYLDGANLDGANLGNGITWKIYLEEVVPALLVAGGRPLQELATEKVWACHSWQNCPMAEAFQVHDLSDIPPLYREEAARFVKFFDAGLIPLPKVG